MYRDEPLTKTLERLQGCNDTLQKRVSKLENSLNRPQNVWHVAARDLRWPLALVASVFIFMGLVSWGNNRPAETITTVLEVEWGTTFGAEPTMLFEPRTNWVEREWRFVCGSSVDCGFVREDTSLWEESYLAFPRVSDGDGAPAIGRSPLEH